MKAPSYLDGGALKLIAETRERFAKVPALARHLAGRDTPQGSNWWVASGALTASGHPLLANDPHLALDTPSVFYEVHLRVSCPPMLASVVTSLYPASTIVLARIVLKERLTATRMLGIALALTGVALIASG